MFYGILTHLCPYSMCQYWWWSVQRHRQITSFRTPKNTSLVHNMTTQVYYHYQHIGDCLLTVIITVIWWHKSPQNHCCVNKALKTQSLSINHKASKSPLIGDVPGYYINSINCLWWLILENAAPKMTITINLQQFSFCVCVTLFNIRTL